MTGGGIINGDASDLLAEFDALLTAVQEMGQLTRIETPAIGIILSLTRQMARIAGVYPVFTNAEIKHGTACAKAH